MCSLQEARVNREVRSHMASLWNDFVGHAKWKGGCLDALHLQLAGDPPISA